MESPEEIEALRTEHRRLREELFRFEVRLNRLEEERRRQPAPPSAVPAVSIVPPMPMAEPAALPADKPVFDAPEIAPTNPEATLPISTPPPLPFNEPATAPLPQAPPLEESLELRFGQVWLVRIGIVILLTGLVFLGNYAYHEFIGRLGAAGKLALLYFAGAALGVLGTWLARTRDSLRNYGRVLAGGGCATIYYATFAAHFVPSLRIIESPILGGSLLLALGGAFVMLADRLRSQTLATATIALAYYTAAMNASATFPLFSNLVISAAAVALLARHRWVSASFLSLVGSYGSFAFWRFHQTQTLFPIPTPDSAVFWAAVLFPAGYWVVHTVAVLLRRVNALTPEERPVFLTLNNAAFFALAGPVVAGTYPDSFWLAAIAFGAVLLCMAGVAARRSPDEPIFDSSYLAQGLALILLGVFLHFVGWQRALSFALLSATLISLGRLRHGGIYRFFAGACALIATTVALQAIGLQSEHAQLTAGGVAAVLTAAAWLLKRQASARLTIDWRAMGFVVLAGLLTAVACTDAELFASGLRLMSIALAATLLHRLVHLREAAYVAQPLALFGQGLLALHFCLHPSAAGSFVALSAAFALAFIHLWQWRAQPALEGRRTWQTFHSVIPITLFAAWTVNQVSPEARGPVLALAALLVLADALATRTWILAGASVALTLCAACVTTLGISGEASWIASALATGLIAAQSPLLGWLGRHTPVTKNVLGQARQLVHVVVIALGVGMIFAYVPAFAWFLALIGAAFGFFMLASAARSIEAFTYAAILAVIGTIAWFGRLPAAAAYWPDLLGFAAFGIAQRIGKRRLAETSFFNAAVETLLCTAATLGGWILLHRLASDLAGGFLLTVSWSLLAMAVMGLGFALRERTYRLLGLVILAAAIGRIFFVDIWQLETIFRILSFLVLGLVLLALGFLYNRHAETLRKWL
jgi:uncharacterized membrane protein